MVPERLLLDKRQQLVSPTPVLIRADSGLTAAHASSRVPILTTIRIVFVRIVVALKTQPDLFEVVGTLDSGGGLPDLLHCRH